MCIYNQLEHLFNPGEWSSQKREANFFTLTGVYVATCIWIQFDFKNADLTKVSGNWFIHRSIDQARKTKIIPYKIIDLKDDRKSLLDSF